jgi:hypothetical protein
MDVAQTIIGTATTYGVNPALALEVATAESGMNPNTPDSSAGAIGIFQLEPATAAQLGVNPRDPAQNIDGGVRYLAQQLASFGDVSEALAAYDWGPGNVRNAMAKYGAAWLAHAPNETQGYVARILGNLGTQYSVSVTAPPAPDPNAPDANASFTAGSSLFADPASSGVAAQASSLSFAGVALLAVLGFVALWAFDEASA